MILEYDFRVIGAERVKSAMGGIEKRFVQHNARMNRELGVPARKGASVVNPERIPMAQAKMQAANRVKAEKHVASVRQREFIRAQRAEERAARTQASERARAERHVASIRQREFARAQRAEEQAERAQAAERIRNEKRVASEARRSEERLQRRRIANARIVGREEARQRKQAAALIESERRARGEFRRRTIGTAGRSVRNTTRAVGAGAAGILAIGGSFAASGAIGNELDLNKRLQSLIVNSRAPGAESQFNVQDVKSKVFETSIATGQSQDQVASGLEMFVQRTGDLEKAMSLLDAMATAATAFNSEPQDIAAAMSDISDKFKIPADELGDMIAVLGAQGRKAAFELKDMASLMPRLAAAGARFGFTGGEGLRTLGGFAQISRTATGSSEQAATAAEATLRQLVSKSAQIQSGAAFGTKRKPGRKVEVFQGGDPTQDTREFTAVMTDVIAASGGDLTQLQGIFGEEGIRAISPLISTYRTASNNAGGGASGEDAGREAVQTMFREAIDSTATYSDVQKDAQEVLASGVNDLVIAQEKLNRALGDDLTPAVIKIANTVTKHSDTIAKAAEAVAKFADFMLANPLAGIGGIIAAKVTADIVAAKIGEKIAASLVGGKAPVGGGAPSVVTTGSPAKGGMGVLGTLASLLGGAALGVAMQEGVNAITPEGAKPVRLGFGFGDDGSASLTAIKENLLNPLDFVQENRDRIEAATGSRELANQTAIPALSFIPQLNETLARLADFVNKQDENIAEASKTIERAGDKMMTAANSGGQLNRSNSPTLPR